MLNAREGGWGLVPVVLMCMMCGRTKDAQFIIISLRNNMFELADRSVAVRAGVVGARL